MGWFRKKSPDVLDLTKLQKKGVLDRSRSIADHDEENNSGKVVDLSAGSSDSGESLGFLSGLAGAGNTGNESVVENLKSARARGADVQSLKIKIEDVEYKLDRFLERLEKIEEKLKD